MINFNRRTRVFVSKEPTDMRASYDTLFSKAKGVLNQDPLSGHLFVFINAKRTSIKCLYWDGTGLVLICKRLNKGTFSRINPLFKGEVVLTPAEFALFFEGASFERRFIDSPKEKRFPVSQELPQREISI
ncbi:MAG: IS66 family insertion sequence element accessory protein TnpB [Bdellovibrionales bacterium]|nr:IS66 family insertion sequence element accessory protein TnpB [Bdellovibrionales bacterium]